MLNFNVQSTKWLITETKLHLTKENELLVAGRNSIVEKQSQKIFDCLKVSEELAKTEAKNLFIMKNVFFSLVFILIGSFAFGNTQSVEKLKNITIENSPNHLKVSIDLGDLSNLSKTELYDLLDNLPKQKFNSEFFDTCTIGYSITISVMGQAITLNASGTAETCPEAGKIARDGLKGEVAQARKMITGMM